MSKFENITIVKKANVYFEGKVTSRTVIFESGEKKTLGIMLPGTYTFSTADKEIMEILGGSMEVKLPGSDAFITYKEGESFTVPSNSSFDLVINEVSDYCCSYIKE
ncbi:pyrimidine/purine nucleoside phosphorylase [Cellulosilyticum sp. I15G10I2]|uniref:pyrimidine/purine nucleoside phosphorylase n=1 Tax=Cellulosilyticum sp. I15G10I2 TaxID=1892843 RepID=UPI00085BC5D4|nr:pyrimidine/purine nucleoside phosphorylase [Cellulosilyticum sp. I15G10I2]